jgi:DNA/RNA endonuclease YhcR with UshA esterase domain
MKFNKKFLSIFFIAILAVVLVACGGTTTEAPTTAAPTTEAPTTVAPTTQAPTTQAPTTVAPTTEAPTTLPIDWATIEASLRTEYSATLEDEDFVAVADLNLLTVIGDANITWSSSNTTYLGHDGTVVRPSYATGNQTVILTATLEIGGQTHEVMFFVTIGKLDKTDQERANEVLDKVMVFPFKEKWSSADSDSLEFLTSATDGDGVAYDVTWESSHPQYIATDGTIVQPEDADVVVTMTATVNIGGVDFFRTKDFTVAMMEEGTPVSSIAEAIALGEDTYVKLLGVTVIAKHTSGDVFLTDGVDIIYIYTPTFQSAIGGVYDISGILDIYYNAPQLTGSDTQPLRAEVSTAAVTSAPIQVMASILDVIADQTMPTPENLFQYQAYTVTAKVYYNSAWGNYSVFLVPSDYDFDAPLADGATQPNGDSIMIYYKSDMTVLQAFHGTEITIDIITQGWRSDKSVWYANFFGTAADVEINIADDQEAVDTALAALDFPGTIVEDTTLDFPASLYGVTLTYTSDNLAIDVTTGAVDAASQVAQITVTLTVDAERGTATGQKVFTIKVGELPVSSVADALAGAKDDLFKIQATIIGGGYATYQIQDGTGAIAVYVASALRTFFAENVGNLVELVGTRDTYNGLNQIRVETITFIEANTLPAAVNVDEEADLLPFQNQLIELTGMAVTAKSTDSYGNINLTLTNLRDGSTIAARWDSRFAIPTELNTVLTNLVVNDIINIQAILGWFNAPQITITAQTVITMTTDAEKLAADVATLPATIETTSGAVEMAPLVGPYGSTIVWDASEITTAGGTYDPVTGEVGYPDVLVDTVYNVTGTVSLGTETPVDVTIAITVLAMTDAEKLAAAIADTGIDQDCDGYQVVMLPLTGLYGTTISWTVISGEATLDVDGTTLTYAQTGAVADVVLEATFANGLEIDTVQYTVTVTPVTIVTDLSTIPAMTNGTIIYVQGVVTAISFDGAFIQDANGVGFFLYRPLDKTNLTIGDEVVYYGTVAEYSSAKQLGQNGVYMELLSQGNALIYNTVTADEIDAFAMADAGSLFTFDGFTFQGVIGSTMTLGYVKADLTPGTVNIRYYTNWSDLALVAENYEIGDALPAVNFILYNFRDGLKQLDVLSVPNLEAAVTAFEANLDDAILYEYNEVGSEYTYNYATMVLNGNTVEMEYLQSTLLAANPLNMYEGILFDLARFLGAIYRTSGSVVTVIEYDGTEYTWDPTGTLKGSNWEDVLGTTLIQVIVDDFYALEITDTLVITLFDTDGFQYELTLTFNISMDLDETVTDILVDAVSYTYDPAYTYLANSLVYDDYTMYSEYYQSVLDAANPLDPLEGIMFDMARYLGAVYRVEGSNITTIIYDGVEYTWNETLGLLGSNWAYYDEILTTDVTLVSVIVDDFQAMVLTDSVPLTFRNGSGHEVAVALEFAIVAETVTYTQDFSFLTTATTSYTTSVQHTDSNGFAWDLLGRQNIGSWMLGNAADLSYIQVTAQGGISSISFDVVRAFTNTNVRSGEVFVNGVSVGTFNVDVNSDVAQVITFENINVTGEVVIEIVTTSPGSRGAYNVDNIIWTSY